ncbi:MAG: hydrogenase maturation protease [Verrucomicrobia bacterium]|nr:hydrogenase maturation protease [Verrucomicrobiota bacterium]
MTTALNGSDEGASDSKAHTLIIGIGNRYRRDDGVGIVVARRLAPERLDGIRVIERSGEGAALLEAWQGAERVIVVDAVQSGAPPGTIHRLDARAQPMPTRFFHYSTHAFSLAEAIELARALDQLPRRLLVYGVEGADFTAGEGLSPEVAAAVDEVVHRLRAGLQPDFQDTQTYPEPEEQTWNPSNHSWRNTRSPAV